MSNVIQMFKNEKDEKGSDTIMVCTKKKWLSLSQLLKIRERKISQNALVGSHSS